MPPSARRWVSIVPHVLLTTNYIRSPRGNYRSGNALRTNYPAGSGQLASLPTCLRPRTDTLLALNARVLLSRGTVVNTSFVLHKFEQNIQNPIVTISASHRQHDRSGCTSAPDFLASPSTSSPVIRKAFFFSVGEPLAMPAVSLIVARQSHTRPGTTPKNSIHF